MDQETKGGRDPKVYWPMNDPEALPVQRMIIKRLIGEEKPETQALPTK